MNKVYQMFHYSLSCLCFIIITAKSLIYRLIGNLIYFLTVSTPLNLKLCCRVTVVDEAFRSLLKVATINIFSLVMMNLQRIIT